MPRGLKTHLKVGRTKVVKGIPPMIKAAPKSRSMPFEQKTLTKVFPTLKGKGKAKF